MVFATIKSPNGEFRAKIGALKDKDGNTLTHQNEVKERKREYTKQLYMKDQNITEQCQFELIADEPEILKSEIE